MSVAYQASVGPREALTITRRVYIRALLLLEAHSSRALHARLLVVPGGLKCHRAQDERCDREDLERERAGEPPRVSCAHMSDDRGEEVHDDAHAGSEPDRANEYPSN